jgi:chemotaxis protein histidine kinase CheA
MIFDRDAAGSLARTFRDKKPAVKITLDRVKKGDSVDRQAAINASLAVLELDSTFDLASLCQVMGHPDALEDLTAAHTHAKSEAEFAENKRLAQEREKIAAKKARDDKRAKDEAEKERKKADRAKAAEMKAEEQRKQNESRKNKTVFTLKGMSVDDITSIIPVVCEWLKTQESVYISGGMLARWSDSKECMQTVTCDSFGALLGLGFSFRTRKFGPTGEEIDEFMSQAPSDIRLSILGTEYFHGIREVDAVLDRPVVLTNGTVIGTTPGYDSHTRFLFHRTEDVQDIDLLEAYRAIHDVFHEFPEQAIPGALALVFTELMRPCLPTAPMIFVNAPALGSGKSLLARCCLDIVSKAQIPNLAQPNKEEEFDKQVKSAIEKYPGRTLLFDDYEGFIEYQILKTILTEPKSIEFRILGSNRSFNAKTNFLTVMTGNGAQLTEELERRSVKVQVDTGLENPSLRKGLSRNSAQLQQHVQDNQRHLLACSIKMLVDALQNSNEHHATRPMGSFEVWADTVGRAVIYCTEKMKELALVSSKLSGDVTPDMQEYVSKLDETGEVLATIYSHVQESSWRIRELPVTAVERLNDLLGTKNDSDSNTKRGKRLAKYAGRPRHFGSATYRLEQLPELRWRVVVTDGSPIPVDPESLDAHLDARNLQVN